jgi:hypothetical protein
MYYLLEINLVYLKKNEGIEINDKYKFNFSVVQSSYSIPGNCNQYVWH